MTGRWLIGLVALLAACATIAPPRPTSAPPTAPATAPSAAPSPTPPLPSPTPVTALPAATASQPPATATRIPPTATVLPAPSPSPTAVDSLSLALAKRPPARDVVDLARRFKGVVLATTTATPAPALGATQSFWVADSARRRHFQVNARLVRQSARVDAWLQEGERLDESGLDRSIERLEASTMPVILGDAPELAGLRVSILNTRVGGIVGYYSSANEHPRAVSPFSNERPLIVMSLAAVQPGTNGYDAGLAHELQHLVQWRLDSGEETWINEGTAELAIDAVGLGASGNQHAYLQRPTVQLNNWAEELSDTPAHYGASYLFFSYLSRRFAGYPTVRAVLQRPEKGLAGVEAGTATPFDRLFLDWIVATWSGPGNRVREEPLAIPTTVAATVPQYAARYYALPEGAAGTELTFRPSASVALVGAPARGGPFWWSNRGDSADSRLTREVDLTATSRATLRFSTWYDLERDYDYGFVSLSADAGKSWRTLPGRRSASSDPNGANFGSGFTGKSEDWVDEEIDLGAYAGMRVLLRFEMVTDDAFNGAGWCLDRIRIEEIGLTDSPEQPGWDAEGFVRIENRAPQRLSALVVSTGSDGPKVDTVQVGSDGVGRTRLPEIRPGGRLGLLVAGHTPLTVEPARFELELRR